MAMRGSFSEADLQCLLCYHIYTDPVSLSCSHSFCKVCLAQYWKKKKTLKCPLCKKRSSKKLPPPNLQLKTMCEKFRQDRNGCQESAASDVLCRLHQENLKLFCLDDQEPVCVVCRDSKTHSNHVFRPLDEAAQEHREEVQSKLNPLEEKFESFLEAKNTCERNLKYIQNQAQHTEKLIRNEFEKLHQFLHDEEMMQISALKKETKKISQMIDETSNSITSEIERLSETIKSIQKELKRNDTTFLKNYKNTVERTECEVKDSKLETLTLIDVAKYVGNLQFRVWKKMKDIVEYYPVILNPNTAHPRLNLSHDLTTIVCQDEHEQLPVNPERFEHHLWVLGSEGFNSGTRIWEVEVENSVEWAVGVMTGCPRKSGFFYCAGVWKSDCQNVTYGVSDFEGSNTILKLKKDLKRIRVQLDWDQGHVSFSDPYSGYNLETILYSFTGKVFPYFYNQCELHPLRILSAEEEQAGGSAHKLVCNTTDSYD